MAGLGQRWRIVRAGLIENLQARRFWSAAPNNRFTRDGFEVIEGFLDREECDRLVQLADELLPGPPQPKASVYLNDLDDNGDGPYTIVPGSHRWFLRKFLNDVVNACTTGARRDMRYLVPETQLSTVLAPAGTLILSTQDAIHKGWTDHWRRPRHALDAYVRTAARSEGGPLTEGVEFLPADGLTRAV